MKTLKFFTALMCCMAAFTFTSCDTDDEYTPLTPEQKLQAFNVVKGNYTGKLVYANPEATTVLDATDSIDVSWTIDTDTTMVIHDFPTAVIARNLTDSVIAKAIATQPTQQLNTKIDFGNLSPVTFLINPIAATYNITYNDKPHKVQAAFYSHSIYSYGSYDMQTKKLRMQLIIGGIFVDGEYRKDLIKGSIPFGLIN